MTFTAKISYYLNLPENLFKLLISSVLFSVISIQFLSFLTAALTVNHSVFFILFLLAIAYTCSYLGYINSCTYLSKKKYSHGFLLKISSFLIALCCLLSSVLPNYLMPLLFLIGAFFTGFGWAERHYLEKIYSTSINKDIYLTLLQSFLSILRIVIPLLLILLTYLPITVNDKFLFNLSVFMLFLSFLFPKFPLKRIKNISKISYKNILNLLKIQNKEYNKYYFLDGANNILKQTLFVLGAMQTVKSINYYGLVESSASLLSGLMLFWLAKNHHISKIDVLTRFKISNYLLFISWLCLILSSYSSIFFFIFVITFSFGLPLNTAFKHSLMLKIALKNDNSAFNLFLHRELILWISRVLFLLSYSFIALLNPYPEYNISVFSFILILFIPLEYYYSLYILKK